jgi:Tfp pilus assembly protein PilN
MVQLNLLPDIKQDYIKAERQRRLIFSVSGLVGVIAIAVLLILLGINFAQKHELNSANKTIASQTERLKQEPNIDTILTVQNQLESLTSLHESKPAAERLFTTYLNQVTPATVSINTLDADFTMDSLTITGTADSLSSINQYVDTFKKTNFTLPSSRTATPAFSNVVLTSFGLASSTEDPSQSADYTVTLNFNKEIFDNTQNVSLSIPSITTRSDVNQPTTLFQSVPSKTTGSSQ